MSSNLKIAAAQLNLWPGALRKNFEKIKQAYLCAEAQSCDLLLTSELALCGYPLYDQFLRPEVSSQISILLEELLRLTESRSCGLVVGHSVPVHSPDSGKRLKNVLSVLRDGKIVFSQAKSLLPCFDVFDESRYFVPAKEVECFELQGHRILLSICEDVWGCYPDVHPEAEGVYLPLLDSYRKLKPSIVLVGAASPYGWAKAHVRAEVHRRLSQDLSCPLVYVNQVGAVDEVVFDGGSFALGHPSSGQVQLPSFEEGIGIFEVESSALRAEWVPFEAGSLGKNAKGLTAVSSCLQAPGNDLELERLAGALVLGIRDYFSKSGFKAAILGLSGGIDSALVAVLASRALGNKSVLGVAMPSQFSSTHSLEDAEQLAHSLGIRYEVKPIKFLYSTSCREISDGRGALAGLASENLQARLRGVILMTLANHEGALVLATGNKSELAMGYCTLYGDMAGALAPIGDLFKTRVYELCRWINQNWGSPIPERSLTKPPSAELRPNQKDQDSLPPYEVLDAILAQYLEQGRSLEELQSAFPDVASLGQGDLRALLSKFEINEYKRKQAAPVLKTTAKSFGIGRRVSLVSRLVRG